MRWFTSAFGKTRGDWAEAQAPEPADSELESDELPAAIRDAVAAACARGDDLAAQGCYAAAVQEYGAAWALTPEPRTRWSVSTWILAAIADAYFLYGDKVAARAVLQDAMRYPGAIGNSFLHLRLGEVLFDAGERDAAAEQLTRAYQGAGEEVFATEDPRYLAFLKSRIKA